MEVLQSQPPLNRSNSTTSLVGPPLSLATTTPPALDENGHVQMNVPRKMSLFGAQESHMSRLPADGQAQVEGEQSSSPKPGGSQKTGIYENQRVNVFGEYIHMTEEEVNTQINGWNDH